MAQSLAKEFTKGLWAEIPPFRLVLGLCPTLAVTKSVENGIGMGLATTFVLVFSAASCYYSYVLCFLSDTARAGQNHLKSCGRCHPRASQGARETKRDSTKHQNQSF